MRITTFLYSTCGIHNIINENILRSQRRASFLITTNCKIILDSYSFMSNFLLLIRKKFHNQRDSNDIYAWKIRDSYSHEILRRFQSSRLSHNLYDFAISNGFRSHRDRDLSSFDPIVKILRSISDISNLEWIESNLEIELEVI